MELAFVTAPRQNHFFLELIAAVRDELDQLGVPSRIVVGDIPDDEPGLVSVLTPPHEWFSLHGWRSPPTPRQLRRTVLLCAEQPQTGFFVDDALIAPFAGALFDISPMGVEEFGRHGRPEARHFQLGWTRTWSTVEPADLRPDVAADGRDVDVLHLGAYSDRRGLALAAGASALARWNTQLILGQNDGPNPQARENFMVDEAKLDLLRRTKVLLNIHQEGWPYFEWLRVVQAMCQGCAVVTEHSASTAPLVPGEHLLSASHESAALVAAGLLEDEALRSQVAAAGYAAVRDAFPLRAAVEDFANVAEHVATHTKPPRRGPLPELRSPTANELDLEHEFSGPVTTDPEQWRTSVMRQALKGLRLDLIDLHRDLRRDHRERRAGGPLPTVEIAAMSPGWRTDRPGRVSVITALYNHEEHIEAALESVVRGSYTDVEFVIVDDGSTDGSSAAVERFMERHPERPVLLARHPVNRGLGLTRNAALELARGEFAFILDADNEVHVHGIRHLVDRLEASPESGFAYGMLDRFNANGPAGLVSYYPWEPMRLRMGNYIDAMALWRRATIGELGHYSTDRRLHGWEDYALWCHCAERGVSGAFVPQIVARYRATMHSMISTTNISTTEAMSVLCERYPTLMAGVVPPP